MSEHTPTPWEARFIPAQAGQDSTYEIVRTGCDTAIATVHWPGLPLEADAEFIVRAVNSHDDLLAALELVAPELHRLYLHSRTFKECDFPECEQARAAIDKAKSPA